jgi:hypothetical protein
VCLVSHLLAEFLKSPSETMILRDEDHSTVIEAGWKRLNTLRHYWVQDGAVFRIKSRRDFPPPGRGNETVGYMPVFEGTHCRAGST